MRTSLTEFEFKGIALDPYGFDRPDWNGKRILHIGLHNSLNKNSGDTVLFPAVRDTFDHLLGPCAWEFKQVWEFFGEEDLKRVNEGSIDGIVIGGGGLLLHGQAGADDHRSGWQWNCPVENLARIEKPVMVFAIGYNRFRGQGDFPPVFTEHMNQLAGQSAFFGLRNNGSIRAVGAYLRNPAHRERLSLQYCPTTLAWQIYPGARAKAQEQDLRRGQILAFNCAFDRPQWRFGGAENSLLHEMACSLKTAAGEGWKLAVVSHKHIDRQIEPFLDAIHVDYASVDLTNASAPEVIDFYAGVDLAVGLRGHAQLIPFGLRRPIISIISHDKMRYFLDDIQHPEWGVDVTNPDFGAQLTAAIRRVAAERAALHQRLGEAQEQVWQQTVGNFKEIDSKLGLRGATTARL